jgi:hypothetical protein
MSRGIWFPNEGAWYLEATRPVDLHRLSGLVFAVCFIVSWLISLGSWAV